MKNINTQFYLANYSCSNTVSNSTQQLTSSTSQKAVLPFDSIIETAELSPRKAYRFDKIVYVKDKHAFAAEYNGIYYSNWKTRDDYMKNGQPNTYALYSNEDDWYAFDSYGNFSTICHSEPEPEPVEPEPEDYSIKYGQTEGSMSDFLNQFGIEDTSEISVEAEEALGELLNDMTVLQFSGSLDIEKTDDIIYIYVPNTVRFIKCIIKGYFSSPLYSQAGNNFNETIELSEGTLYIYRDPVGESTLEFTFSKNNG